MPAGRLAAQAGDTIRLETVLEGWMQNDGHHFLYEPRTVEGIFVRRAEADGWYFPDIDYDDWKNRWGIGISRDASGIYLIKPIKPDAYLSGRITSDLDEPLAGAYVFVEGAERGTTTDLNGSYKLNLPGGLNKIVVSYTGYESVHEQLFVTYGREQRKNFRLADNAELGEVLVVGSRFPPKPLLHGMSAADVITSEATEQLPQVDVSQWLQYLTPSFHSAHQTISDGSDHVDPAALRGLSPDQVLVLVNGKRRHQSAQVHINNTIGRGSVGVDLNAIPSAAIERVEILLDGAAAQYGTDAIAGVINFVLKDGDSPATVSLEGGLTTAGDGEAINFEGFHAWRMKQGGFVGMSLRWNHRGEVNRSGAYTGPIFGDARDDDPLERAAFFGQTGYNNERVMEVGSAAVDNVGLFVNWASPGTGDFQFYGHLNGNFRLGRAVGFYRFPHQERRQSGLYPLGFSPEIWTDILDFSVVNGLRGKKGEWDIDLSHNYGGNDMRFLVRNSNNASLGIASPTSARAGGFRYTQHVFNADFSRAGGTDDRFRVAGGIQTRLEAYEQRAGDEWSWEQYDARTGSGELKEGGIQVFPGYQPTNAGRFYRLNASVYGQVEYDLSDKWLVETGGRWEYYPTYGLPASGKLAVRYKPHEKLSVHASVGLGYRAPSLPQLFFSSQAYQFLPEAGSLSGQVVAHLNSEHPIARRLGLSPPRSERARHLSMGAAWTPGTRWQISLDVYRVRIKDRLLLSGPIFTRDLPQDLLPPGSDEPARIQLFANALATGTQGLESKLRYRQPLFKGRLDVRAAAGFYRTGLLDLDLPEGLRGLEDVVFNREDRNRLERGQPASKVLLGVNWRGKRWSVFAQNVRFGSVRFLHPDDGDPANWLVNERTGRAETRDQTFRGKWITNLSLGYRFSQRLRVMLNGSNVFNVYPDEHRHGANIENGIFRYSRYFQQFGVDGARWSVRVAVGGG